jgi:hypothetical protein
VRFNRAFAVLATTVILSLLAVATLPTPALAAPVITLAPTSGTAGTTVSINGQNFGSYAGDKVHIYFNNTEVAGSPIEVPSTGTFSYSFQVPDSAMPGRALVTVRDVNGSQLGEGAEFFVPQPLITLNKGGGFVGTKVMIAGEGFLAAQDIALTYTGPNDTTIYLGSTKANSIGEFSFAFDVPESTGQEHKVIAADAAGNEAEASFNVIPSVVLKPEAGAIGDAVVATGTGFGHNSRIIIEFDQKQVVKDKADANGSFRINFNAPDMKLQAYKVTISDAAGNVAVSSFTINAGEPSFVFPQWGVYAIIGLAAVALFLIGIWVGRKYAYSY